MMSKEEAKKLVLEACEFGIKGPEIPQKLSGELLESFDLPSLLEELVKSGLLIEIEYSLPVLPYKLKSFYLPKGTTVAFVSNL